MQITVKDRVVKHNLELLKDLLHRAKQEKFKAWIETTTGEIRTKPPSGGPKKESAWVAVQIHLQLSPSELESGLCIDEDTKKGEKVFNFEGWTTRARHAVLETCHAINNKLAAMPRAEKGEFLERFASAQISLLAQRKEKHEQEFIQEAWHDLDREGAEVALENHRKGTYLFRKDPFAEVLEAALQSRFGKSPYCITLTYLDEMSIVRDKTLVFKDKRILVYDDDPQLLEPRYATIEEAMHHIDPLISIPLKAK